MKRLLPIALTLALSLSLLTCARAYAHEPVTPTEDEYPISGSYLLTPFDESTDPTDPSDPTNPSDPSDPTDPSEPEEPTEPEDPTDPSEPEDPTDPTDPDDPGDEPEPVVLPFTDIRETHWFYGDVCFVYANGIMNGMSETQFMPDRTLTRGEVVTVLYRVSGQPETLADCPFSDVPSGEYYFTPVLWAAENGIVNGVTETTFCPKDPITREQFFSIIGNFLMVVEFNRIDDTTVDLTTFSDGHLVQEYAKPATRLLYSMGIVKGSGGKLEPRAHTQCQQALAMFYRTYLYYQRWVDNSQNEHENGEGREEAAALVDFALQFVGYDYVWGAEHPDDGFDCSGLVYYVYRHFGYKVGRTATNQWYYEDSWEVSKDELLPCDLIFFHDGVTTYEISHIGIYIGDGLFVHAANSKRGVVVDAVDSDYYTRHYFGARRIIP